MLHTLEDAWRWYQDTRTLLKFQQRLGRYWDELPWDGPLGKDSTFNDLKGDDLRAKGDNSLLLLDDLAILVFFSVFESIVRQHVLNEVSLEEAAISHRTIKHAVAEAKERIEFGSFFHVLEPFKDQHHDLVAQVDQIRNYRNWVAHGQRGSPTNNVEPQAAYDRLREFLAVLRGQPDSPDSED